MNQTHSAELYRHGGPEKQLVTVSVGPDGVDLGALDSGLASSKLGAATTTNIGSMFRRTKFTIYCSLCCANGTPVEATPSMNFGLFAKRKESNTSGAAGHSVARVSLDCGRGRLPQLWQRQTNVWRRVTPPAHSTKRPTGVKRQPALTPLDVFNETDK
jgi:hypothetical protein